MNIFKLVEASIYKGTKPSSYRMFSYVMMLIIFLFGLTCIGIEVVNAGISWHAGKPHVIPGMHVTLVGMWLAHQLTLLGIYKSNEAKIPQLPQDKPAEEQPVE